ncbi:hypothetical protein [Ferrimicrobium sp.]|uniref:hypothetical protein n=1 Tax=Ferrimicrobium sp. TaxID=2926050 RepID=UPI00262531C5|nr:hypothetical protein [Ferrimicrobium sp.]
MRTLADFAAYRPATISRIAQALAADSSSYLLKGPRGSGADELLGAIAQTLVGDCGGCGECASCRAVADGEHPDVLLAQGEQHKPVAVEELRRIVRFASLAPTQARYRVVVIPDIDTLRLTFPVILKALEEPPTATKWLLSAALIGSELAPVASRCLTIELEAPSDVEIEHRFREHKLEPSALLIKWTRHRLDRVELFARLTDPERYLSTYADLPSLIREDARWCMELAHRLMPEELGSAGESEEIIQCGLEVLVAAHTDDGDWLRRATRASASLNRHLPLQLVLAELILRSG